MVLSIPCAACGYRMRSNLVGVTFRQLVVDPDGRSFPVPDGHHQYFLCRTCAPYFERGFSDLVDSAMVRQDDTAAHGAASSEDDGGGRRSYLGCDLCLLSITGEMHQVQYSRGAFIYGQSQLRVTPDSTRLRDVNVCVACATYLGDLLQFLIEERGRPARPLIASASG